MNKKELIRLKDKIEQTKSKMAELKGKEEYLLQELKSKFGCESIEKAEATIKRLEKEIRALNQQIEKGLSTIQKDYLNRALQDHHTFL